MFNLKHDVKKVVRLKGGEVVCVFVCTLKRIISSWTCRRHGADSQQMLVFALFNREYNPRVAVCMNFVNNAGASAELESSALILGV